MGEIFLNKFQLTPFRSRKVTKACWMVIYFHRGLFRVG